MPPVDPTSTTLGLQTWVPLLVAGIALIGTLAVPIINMLLTQRNARAAALAAAEVARKLAETTVSTDKKLDHITHLVDGESAEQRRLLGAARDDIRRLERALITAGEPMPPESPPAVDPSRPSG